MGVLLTLLSHALGDGFGATDVSGICQTDPETLRHAMKKVFGELLFNGFVLWSTWFSVTAISVWAVHWTPHWGSPVRQRTQVRL